MWYNSTVTEIKLVQIHVEYMDGTEETIDGDDVMDMSNKQSVYYEKVQKPEEIKRAEREKQREIEYAEWKKKEDAKKRKEELMQAYKCYKVLSCISKTKDDEEMKLHVNQGIWLFIIEILAVILLFIVPKVGPFICLALIIVAVVFSNIGIKAVKENKSFELPILGKVKLFK